MNTLPNVVVGSVVILGQPDRARVAAFCRECTGFFQLVEGRPGGEATADEILGPLPSRITSGVKWIFGVEREETFGALAELLEGYPRPHEWYVGLLVLLPALRRLGWGTHLWSGLRDWMIGRGARAVRLIVQKQNPSARAFWEKQGFTVEEEGVAMMGERESAFHRMLWRP